MALEMVSRVQRYQGQCRELRPLGHQGHRLSSYKKDPPLHTGYISAFSMVVCMATPKHACFKPNCCNVFSSSLT